MHRWRGRGDPLLTPSQEGTFQGSLWKRPPLRRPPQSEEATMEEASQPTPKPPPELEAEEEVKEAGGSFPRAKRQRAATPPKLKAEERGSRGDKPKRSASAKARGAAPKTATPRRAPGGQRNYVKIVPGGKVDHEVQELADSIRLRGKSVRSRKQYSSGERHWRHLRAQIGWPLYVTGLSPQTISEQAVYFAAAEVKLYGLSPGALRSKFSAIRWMHVRDYHPDPFKDMATLAAWLSDYAKRSPPPQPKLTAPLSLVEYLIHHLVEDSLTAAVVEAAVVLGFWFVLRSIEYLADDEGVYDPGLTVRWEDFVFRKQGEVLPLSKIQEADEMTIVVYSAKGSLHTCTRTLMANPNSKTCVVAAHKKLYAAYIKLHGKAPRKSDSPYRMEDGKVLTRAQLSNALKGAAVECGIAASRIASHSLRRGGASAYAAAGVPDVDIRRFGRWTSYGFKVYVTAHADMMRKGLLNPATAAPRFEMH